MSMCPTHDIILLKFGGSSLSKAAGFMRAATIARTHAAANRVIAVVSAVGGVTDLLETACRTGFLDIPEMERSHLPLASELRAFGYQALFRQAIRRASSICQLILAGDAPDSFRHELLAQGERLSAPLMAAAIRTSGGHPRIVDGTSLIACDESGRACAESTRERTEAWLEAEPIDSIAVVTGFIGSTSEGRTVTLGRGGSDYSAALLASSLGARRLERWTDVDALYTHDPNRHHQALPIASLSTAQAHALAMADLIGMHRRAFEPLLEAPTTLYIRSFLSEGPGTIVVPSGPSNP